MGSEKEERQPGKHHFSVVILTTGLIQARISQGKAARAEYNRSLSALEQAQRVALHAHAPRFAPLGIDHEGRTYFALTPGVAERDAAAALLAGDTSKGGKAHGRVIVSADERRALRRWGWFVAVWGQKPADGLVPASEEDDDDGDEEESDDDDATVVERWWGLWQAGEIRKLADWVAIKNGFAGGEQPIAEDEAGVSGPDARRYPPTTEAESNGSRSGVQSSHLTPLSDASDTEDEAGVPYSTGGRGAWKKSPAQWARRTAWGRRGPRRSRARLKRSLLRISMDLRHDNVDRLPTPASREPRKWAFPQPQ